MKRRDFIALLGSAATWPLAALGQPAQGDQPPRPVIGFLNNIASDQWQPALNGFSRGLSEAGRVESDNVDFTYRWTDGRTDRLPELAADLARAKVSVIVASADTKTALAARSAAPNIPIVFVTEDDPVRFGLVGSLVQPGGHATGIYLTRSVIDAAVRREFWRLLVPSNQIFLRIEIFDASSVAAKTDPEAAFAFSFDPARRNNPRVVMPPVRALEIDTGPFLDRRRRSELVSLASRHGIPALYHWRVFAEEGGLISYGIDIEDVYARMGRYAGAIVNGENPSLMPVLKPVKFESALNLRTAAELGLSVSPELLARVDKVIE